MKKVLLSLLSAGVLASSCANQAAENPLLVEWNTPYGIPPFEQVQPEHYLPAFKAAMAAEIAEIDAIVNNTEEPTFENTIEAYANTGELLSNVSAVFSSANGVKSSPELQAIAKELSPLQSAHYSSISLNEKLFQRIKAVYEKRNEMGLNPQQLRAVEEIYKGFERGGATFLQRKKRS